MSGCDDRRTPMVHTHLDGQCSYAPSKPRTNQYGQRLTVTYHVGGHLFCETCGLVEPDHITSTCPFVGLRVTA